ncbi:MAG: phosphatidylserine decarboxylase [Firmicutes bacterium]|jgi:phosphatidylserine decarboxylase|nr:phosphatidylserine decarboxylase [Bacillota bacterium]
MVAAAVVVLAACTLVGLRWFLWKVWFYRDPVRHPPAGPGLILSPADGTVVYIKRFKDGRVISEKRGEQILVSEIGKGAGDYGGSGWMAGIYMSPLDVHWNYAPISGLVTAVIATPASVNLPMLDLWEYVRMTLVRKAVDLFAHRYRLVNERNTVFFEPVSPDCPRVVVVEIADKFVNKIRCIVKPGDKVTAGDKVSFIERGSQVDLLIYDEEVEFRVKPGDHVTGAVTVVAAYRPGRRDPSSVTSSTSSSH